MYAGKSTHLPAFYLSNLCLFLEIEHFFLTHNIQNKNDYFNSVNKHYPKIYLTFVEYCLLFFLVGGVMKKITFITIVLLIISIYLGAIPAYPKPISYQLPDGAIINVILKGDERVKWAETEDGYTVLFNQQGFLEYAQPGSNGMTLSNLRVSPSDRRTQQESAYLASIPKHLKFSEEQVKIMKSVSEIQRTESQKAFPPSGSRKLIMLLIGFTDKAFTRTQEEFSNLMNQTGYSVNGASGSVKDWFNANSFNTLNLTTDVAGPFTASNTIAYYGANDANGYDLRPGTLVTEAINLADPTVNFTQYDNDGDTKVDGVYVIYAGYGEEAGGGVNTIWAHASSITQVIKDGVKITSYSCSPELKGNATNNPTGIITNIGVICHEFSHVCGLPDYYDTDYEGSGGQSYDLEGFDPMASGSWNNDGKTPPVHNCYSKTFLGWQTTTELNSPAVITLPRAVDNNVSYKYNTTTNNEFFMLENRQKISWDAYIPAHGLYILHVDKNWVGWSSNDINSTPTHQGMDMEEADNIASSSTSPGDLFPGTSGNTSFTDITSPNALSWAGNPTNKPITEIQEISGVISFKFMGGDTTYPPTISASATGSTSVSINWQQASGYPTVMLAYNTSDTFGTPQDGIAYSAGQNIVGGGTVLYTGTNTQFTHSALIPSTHYYYKVWSVKAGNTYSYGNFDDAVTYDAPMLPPYAQDFNASTGTPQGWSINDYQGNGQVWMIGTVTGGLINTGNYAYLNSDGYGSGNTQKSDLVSPNFDFTDKENVTLTFSHYFRQYLDDSFARLDYSTDGGNTWTTISTWTATTSKPANFSQEFPSLADQNNVKFRWYYEGSYAYYWCVDNISITATPIETLPVELSSFTAIMPNSAQVSIKWITASESNMLGYRVFRNLSDQITNAQNVTPVIIPALNQPQQSNYVFNDLDFEMNLQYYYWLEAVKLDGNTNLFGPVTIKTEDPGNNNPLIPLVTRLREAYPNPFNPSTSIRFELATEDHVKLSVYNAKGQLIKTLCDKDYPAGFYNLVWNGKDTNGQKCASGIYFYHFETKQVQTIKKMLLVK